MKPADPTSNAEAPDTTLDRTPGTTPAVDAAVLDEIEVTQSLPKLNFIEAEAGAADAPKGGKSGAARKKLPKGPIIVGAIVGLLILLGGAGAAVTVFRPKAVVVASPPTPQASATPSQSPTPSPSPSATPAPTAVPVAQTVTAPAAAPTVDHPQAVIVRSGSGLWLRSSPTSANNKNVISWIPNGATVSVDATGTFWWHGTYGGKTGYFASSYTN